MFRTASSLESSADTQEYVDSGGQQLVVVNVLSLLVYYY
jgi:hypothetical protein